MRRRRPPDEILVTLRGRLEGLPARSPERQRLILGCADLGEKRNPRETVYDICTRANEQ